MSVRFLALARSRLVTTRAFAAASESTFCTPRSRLNSSTTIEPLPSMSISLKTALASPLKRIRILQPSANSAMLSSPLPFTSMALKASSMLLYFSNNSVMKARAASDAFTALMVSLAVLSAATEAELRAEPPSHERSLSSYLGDSRGEMRPRVSCLFSLSRRMVNSRGFSTIVGTSRASSGKLMRPSESVSMDRKICVMRLLYKSRG
mmetsp:Transcript_1700/g.5052  ORF Transcript_1700/g.5052 Transcript_1700/m.5052 type:complete len:207 (+) Transcript_1700:364-984(+)